jgi:ferric-dicitrate binding protein FerR (iron transport regulator)
MRSAVRSIPVWIFLTMASFISSFARAQGPPFAGTIVKLVGQAKIERAGKEIDAAPSMRIQVNDRLRTLAGAEVTIELRDGSRLVLSESSAFTVDAFAQDRTARQSVLLKLWAGHLRAIATAVSRLGSFEVHTPNATVGVRGTDFETAFIEGRPCPEVHSCMRYTTVGVNSGIVEVSNPLSPKASPVRVMAGYETTVPCELAPTSPAPLGMEEMGAPGYH